MIGLHNLILKYIVKIPTMRLDDFVTVFFYMHRITYRFNNNLFNKEILQSKLKFLLKIEHTLH